MNIMKRRVVIPRESKNLMGREADPLSKNGDVTSEEIVENVPTIKSLEIERELDKSESYDEQGRPPDS
jgi:hypothetical protein